MKHYRVRKKRNWKNIVGAILLITLLLSIVYASINIVLAPSSPVAAEEYEHVKSDYVLMLVQCILGIIVMMVPIIIERKWSIGIPNYMFILFFLFLFCAIYLGEVRKFYYLIPYWDTILHAFSGAMLGAMGFTLVSILNDAKRVKIKLSPFFVALFAFCFALAVGTLWEIYEYACDGFLTLNMQKYALEDGTILRGHQALADTMEDLIVDCISSFLISIIGFLSILNKNHFKDFR